MNLLAQIFIVSMLIHAAFAIHCYVCSPNTGSGETWDKCIGKDKLDDAVKGGKAESKDCSAQGVCCYCEMPLPAAAGLQQTKTAITYCGIQGQAQCNHGAPWNCSTCTSGDNCNSQLYGSQQQGGSGAGASSDSTTSNSVTVAGANTNAPNNTPNNNNNSSSSNNNNSSSSNNTPNNNSNAVAGSQGTTGKPNNAAAKALLQMPALIGVVLFAMFGR